MRVGGWTVCHLYIGVDVRSDGQTSGDGLLNFGRAELQFHSSELNSISAL